MSFRLFFRMWSDKLKDSILYKILRPLIKCFYKIVFRPQIEGRENIPEKGRIILAGNHTSNYDGPLLISAVKRDIHFLAKKELWSGAKGVIFSHLGLIPVDRSRKAHDSLILAENYLKHDLVIGIFPEGTTEKKGEMLKFKMGAVKMAKDTKTKIVPFIITGKYKPFRNNLKIKFLKPIVIKEDLKEENERLWNIIKEERERML